MAAKKSTKGRATVNPDTGLTDKQENFARLLAHNIDIGDSEAYRQSYNAGRMKPATISRKAVELKENPKVAAYMARLRQERCERTNIDADYVLRSAVAAYEMDFMDIMNDDGSIKPIRDWPKVWRINTNAIEVAELFEGAGSERAAAGLLKKIKIPDKSKMLEMVGKHVDVQAFKDRVESVQVQVAAEIPKDSTPKEAADFYQDLLRSL